MYTYLSLSLQQRLAVNYKTNMYTVYGHTCSLTKTSMANNQTVFCDTKSKCIAVLLLPWMFKASRSRRDGWTDCADACGWWVFDMATCQLPHVQQMDRAVETSTTCTLNNIKPYPNPNTKWPLTLEPYKYNTETIYSNIESRVATASSMRSACKNGGEEAVWLREVFLTCI